MSYRHEYYRISKQHQAYKGVRYFKFTFQSDTTLTVVMDAGDTKRGKGNNVGIYTIHYMTFISNYMGRYVEPCTKDQFNRAFLKMAKALINHKTK